MTLKIYLRRALKFTCFFAVIYGVLLLLFYAFSNMELTISIQTVIGIIIFGMIYPLIGFQKKKMVIDFQKYPVAIIKENIEFCGYRCMEEDNNNVLKFVYIQNVKKIFAAFEDMLTVVITENGIEVEGLRRDVALLILRLNHKLK